MASNLVIYTTVCVFLNGSADLAREEDPPLICVFALGKMFHKTRPSPSRPLIGF